MQCLITILCFCASSLGWASARPQFQQQYQQSSVGGVVPVTPVPIILDERVPIDNLGGYGFRIQTGNGIDWTESAAGSSVRSATGPVNQVVKNGAYSFTHPDGTVHQMRYTADANGFRAESPMIPTPFPLLPWQLEQVRFAEEQRRLQSQATATATTSG